ncbi:ATP/GTP-binding protein [Sphingobacteriaceae bacterium]|nr:ATP/GTP-binding protein [Sphingobacteriaceae bacterium]
MKQSLIYGLTGLLALSTMNGQTPDIQKIWETEANLRVPESVIMTNDHKVLYFSNIEGETNAKDTKGSIGKMDPNGKVLNVDWLTGLNAPKGLAIHEGKLYVADVDELVVIDIKEAKVLERISIFDAKFLNDVTIAKNGIIYVSDTRKAIISRVENNAVSVFISEVKGVNGLLAVDDRLYFLSAGALWRADTGKVVTKIAEGMDESVDGLIQTKAGNFIVSCWSGIIYHVKPDGSKTILLDTREQKLNTADIGYDSSKNIIYVPTFYGNKIVAYKLKE